MFGSENILCKFGTQLEVIEEDEIPTKKPVSVEDQIVTDSNGKRRFHGAFTGGFSAGFWNTVGSLEGWKPQQYKSSRSEKAETKAQKPVDFMDEEDLGEFGIAPQRIQTTEDFSTQESSSTGNIRKRKYIQSLGPIPGIPVLQKLLQPARESVAIRLLKKMGWKVGQGIGARQTRKEKKAASKKITSEHYGLKNYGCEVGPLEYKRVISPHEASESDDTDEEITYAPDDYEQFFVGVKDNMFGLGYVGLKTNPLPKIAQHIDLFGPFEMMSKNNKKLSIRGQAFGVGALEEEDEDIYAKEDMTKYDFSLDDRKSLPKKRNNVSDVGVIDGFHVRENENVHKTVFQVDLPEQFKPRNWTVRRSRFEPLDEEKAVALKLKNEHKRMGLGRHDLGHHERRNILENLDKKSYRSDASQPQECVKNNYWKKINQKYKDRDSKTAQVLSLLETNKSNFTTGGLLTIDGKETNLQDEVIEKLTEVSNIADPIGKNNTIFKPFVFDERKQNRYDTYLEANLKTDEEITSFLETIQPLEMSDWDKEMEKKEFIQASKIYKPLKGLMSDRFITEGSVKTNTTNQETYADPKKTEVKRTKIIWHPCALLCKRFNVAQPYVETKIEDNSKKKSRFSVFDYIEAPINTKKDFVTPVIIPSKIEKSKEIISQNECDSFENQRLTTKELFIKEKQNFNQCNTNSTICDTNKKQPISSPALSSGEINASSKVTAERNLHGKMELEKQIKAMKNEHASEKKDLFKAIFESSSGEEDENSNERGEDSSSNTEIYTQKSVNLKASPAELNILRNTSPPRGIFAYLFSEHKEQKPLNHDSIKKTENYSEKDFKDEDKKGDTFGSDPIVEKSSSEYYGPAIPTVRTIVECSKSSSKIEDLDEKLTKLVTKSKNRVKLVEEWIEKSGDKKAKKRKKNKKKKSKKTKKEKHIKSSDE